MSTRATRTFKASQGIGLDVLLTTTTDGWVRGFFLGKHWTFSPAEVAALDPSVDWKIVGLPNPIPAHITARVQRESARNTTR